MKKITFFLATILLSCGLWAQQFEIPEIINEKLSQEETDLTIVKDFEEVNLSEENYYRSISRNSGTDTIIGYKWNHHNQEWVMRDRIIKIYDANEQVTEKFYQYLSPNNGWVNGIHYTYTYDNNGNRTGKVIRLWHRIDQEWVNWHQRLNTFNNLDKLVETKTQRWAPDTGIWVNRHQRLFAYDSETMLADTIKYWRLFQAEWKNKYFNKYIYDSTGQIKARVVFDWKPFYSIWVKERRHLYFFNDLDQLAGAWHQNWHPFLQIWTNAARNLFQYDDNGNRTTNLFQKWNRHTNDWKGKEMRLFTYDANDLLTEVTFKHKRFWQQTWHNYRHLEFEYDADGNMIEKLVQHWSEYFQEWYNFRLWQMVLDYKNTTAGFANNPDKNLEVRFANPYKIGSPIMFSGMPEGTSLLKVYDLSGKLITSRNVHNDRIYLNENMEPGLYIMTLEKDNKILKQEKMIISR